MTLNRDGCYVVPLGFELSKKVVRETKVYIVAEVTSKFGPLRAKSSI